MKDIENKYDVKYKIDKNGDRIATLFKNNELIHTINVDHLVWQHFYDNKWVN